ncbi:Short-chain dehydrogenase/reductase 3 [Bulinus truncatus]|nr:Short-chain dehydrogenase/reductase 3 [Bulinus truncatus]
MKLIIVVKDIGQWLWPLKRETLHDIILITGGGKGIGRKLALTFAKYRPKHIILWGRTETALSQTAREVQDLNINCTYMICDVSSREQIYFLAKEVEAKFGPVSLLVNNAGVVFGNSILSSDPAETEMTFRTNTLAHFWTVRAFLPGMIKQNKGHIVAVSSMLGLTPLNGAGDYCSSKFAASGFMESLREELKSSNASGITVTTVYPYHVDNNMFAGISTRFPALFPAINEDYLAHKIVDAILTNREKVIVPKLMYFVAFFYSIAPVSAIAAIMRFTGVHKAMDQFKQHHKKP